MSHLICRRCFVSGRVQGVFYRASTREQALRLGLTGHARNLADGRVEVLVVGAPGTVDSLIQWLQIGPPAAHVTDVAVQEVDPIEVAELPREFTTR